MGTLMRASIFSVWVICLWGCFEKEKEVNACDFPSLSVGRRNPAVISDGNHLLVAGGGQGNAVSTIDIFDSNLVPQFVGNLAMPSLWSGYGFLGTKGYIAGGFDNNSVSDQ